MGFQSVHRGRIAAAVTVAWALGVVALPATAQQAPSPATSSPAGSSDAGAQPAVQSRNGVSYVNGGIGESGQQQVKELGRDMNLQLTFARAAGGNYMAQVEVSIAEKGGGKVLELKSADPLLFVQLKPGTYVVTATAEGKSLERTVSVPAKGQHAEKFTW